MVALGLHGCMQAFSSCSKQGLLFIIAVCGFLVRVASLAAEQKLQACGFQYLWHTGSVVACRSSSWTLKCWFQQLQHTGLVAPCRVESSAIRDWTHVPALPGKFFITESLQKSLSFHFVVRIICNMKVFNVDEV